MATTPRRTLARALTLAGTFVVLAVAHTVPAHAAPVRQAAPVAQVGRTQAVNAAQGAAATAVRATPVHRTTTRAAFEARVIRIASSRKGAPYVYGGSGPRSFDCSGLTRWTFAKLGRHLPHSSSAQYGHTKHIRASDRRKGDLVFFHDGGGIYHVGIYAGHNQIWHAPYPGKRVSKEHLWTRSVYYGRVR